MAFSDEDIIEMIRCDKEVGIQYLFDRYYRLLVLYADEYLENIEASEDLVQELFLRFWESDHLLENIKTSLNAYLYVSIRNSCYTYCQKKDILRHTETIHNVEILEETSIDWEEEWIEKVMHAVDELPHRTRQVVEAVMIRGLKYQEVADELSISINTVKFLLKEGMKRLRSQFSSFDKMCLFLLFQKIRDHVFPLHVNKTYIPKGNYCK